MHYPIGFCTRRCKKQTDNIKEVDGQPCKGTSKDATSYPNPTGTSDTKESTPV